MVSETQKHNTGKYKSRPHPCKERNTLAQDDHPADNLYADGGQAFRQRICHVQCHSLEEHGIDEHAAEPGKVASHLPEEEASNAPAAVGLGSGGELEAVPHGVRRHVGKKQEYRPHAAASFGFAAGCRG